MDQICWILQVKALFLMNLLFFKDLETSHGIFYREVELFFTVFGPNSFIDVREPPYCVLYWISYFPISLYISSMEIFLWIVLLDSKGYVLHLWFFLQLLRKVTLMGVGLLIYFKFSSLNSYLIYIIGWIECKIIF